MYYFRFDIYIFYIFVTEKLFSTHLKNILLYRSFFTNEYCTFSDMVHNTKLIVKFIYYFVLLLINLYLFVRATRGWGLEAQITKFDAILKIFLNNLEMTQ